jgi:hypothetical protein
MKRLLGSAALLMLVFTADASAVTRFVTPTGSDSSVSCGVAAPCKNINPAVQKSSTGDVVVVDNGISGDQTIQARAGATDILVRSRVGHQPVVRSMDNYEAGITFDNIDIDAGGDVVTGFENHGVDGVTYRNSTIRNVTDEKGALVSGADFTFDTMRFEDVYVTDSSIHNECVYAIVVPGFTIRDSSFEGCATMDLFFSYGDWWDPLPPAYGDVVIEGNVFGFSTMINPAVPHYYGLYVGNTRTGSQFLDDWAITDNCFEQTVASNATSGTGSWSGNVGPSLPSVSGMTYSGNTDSGSGVVPC